MIKIRCLPTCAMLGMALLAAADARAAALSFVGSDSDIGGTFFPGGSAPYVVVPWRSEGVAKNFDLDGNDVYGSAGYAMFATQFNWPNQGCCGSSVPFDSATYPNQISLPSFVTDSLNLTTNKVGGWTYALIDDPELVNGYRDYNWGDTQVPPVVPPSSQSPYVKLGILDGGDIFGQDPKVAPNGAGRWAFTVGAGVPNKFRVGVMTDGLDDTVWAATEVLLHQIGAGNAIVGTATTGAVVRNRFVDIHTFDIVGAQPGDTFAIFAKAPATGFGNGAISGVTFDILSTAAGTPGDYNSDGFVNAADYTVWRDHLGQTFQLQNEGAGQTPGEVTSEDYDFWNANFTGGGGAAAVGVPEPGALVFMLTAVVGCIGGWRRR